MAITTEERRFLRNWEEQKEGGKRAFVAVYTLGFTLLVFLCSVALGLFMSIPFITVPWLIAMGVGSVASGFLIAFFMWQRQQKRFKKIIQREMQDKP